MKVKNSAASTKRSALATRAELLKRMSPERRALSNRIRKRREAIGDIGFDSVKAIRDVRDHG